MSVRNMREAPPRVHSPAGEHTRNASKFLAEFGKTASPGQGLPGGFRPGEVAA